MPETVTSRVLPTHLVYGCAMRHAAAKGDLAQMKAVAAEAEQFLAQHGDVRTALEVLKAEIVKLETRGQ